MDLVERSSFLLLGNYTCFCFHVPRNIRGKTQNYQRIHKCYPPFCPAPSKGLSLVSFLTLLGADSLLNIYFKR